jgi:hypothetical protein
MLLIAPLLLVSDSVGPGIYGGRVQRDEHGSIIIGKQFQNHNPMPGPVYDGGGYTAMSKALSQGVSAVEALLKQDPSLVNEISTGGAQPLHMAGQIVPKYVFLYHNLSVCASSKFT